jgi:tagatose 1,6-diphosphate aldolase
MAFQITERKKGGLRAVADSRGVIAALAIDQRSALRKLLAQAMNTQAEKVPGRLPAFLDHWSARRLVAEAGADSVKVLLYYSSTNAADINDAKHSFIERVRAACAEAEIPFSIELVSYGEGMEDKSAEFARIKPEVVARAMEEFSEPKYRVGILKVGCP